MNTSNTDRKKNEQQNAVIDIFTGNPLSSLSKERIIRLSPEYDGLCMLYSTNRTDPEKLYSMKILGWGIRSNGEIVGVVPWLNNIVACNNLCDPDSGVFEGYYDPANGQIFDQPPAHKITELETASRYYNYDQEPADTLLQEIPDSIGTHAMLNCDQANSLILTEVLSWQLLNNGEIQAMLIDEELVDATPVLPGDPSLYPAKENPDFRYFFQHHIANQIKSEDPDALAALSLLLQ